MVPGDQTQVGGGAGCNGAAEKGSAKDMAVIGRMIREFIEKKSAEAIEKNANGFRGTIESMAKMIGKWNEAIN